MFGCFNWVKKKVPTLDESKQVSEEYIYETEQDLARKSTRVESLEKEVKLLKLALHKHRTNGKRNDPPFNMSIFDRKVLELRSARAQYNSVYNNLQNAQELLNATEESIRALRSQAEVVRVSNVLKVNGITKKQVEVIDKSVDNLSDARDNVLNTKEAMREIQTEEDDLVEDRTEARDRELEDIELEEEEEIDVSSLPAPPKPKRVAVEEYA
jgi:hypothetical protein